MPFRAPRWWRRASATSILTHRGTDRSSCSANGSEPCWQVEASTRSTSAATRTWTGWGHRQLDF
eukprot:11021461-Lingulodinium_polyedra.AAC.1